MPQKAQDPVCGMDVSKQDQRKGKHQDEEYFFCSDACNSKFKENPGEDAPCDSRDRARPNQE